MFDVSFSELMVIAIVALVVIGPERLPKVARALGLLFGRAQRYVSSLKADLEHEMQLDELRRIKRDVQSSAEALRSSVENQIVALRRDISSDFEPDHKDSTSPSEVPDPAMPQADSRHETASGKGDRS